MNLTSITSCSGDRDVTAMTADVSHVALQHSASISWQAPKGRKSWGKKPMPVTITDKLSDAMELQLNQLLELHFPHNVIDSM